MSSSSNPASSASKFRRTPAKIFFRSSGTAFVKTPCRYLVTKTKTNPPGYGETAGPRGSAPPQGRTGKPHAALCRVLPFPQEQSVCPGEGKPAGGAMESAWSFSYPASENRLGTLPEKSRYKRNAQAGDSPVFRRKAACFHSDGARAARSCSSGRAATACGAGSAPAPALKRNPAYGADHWIRHWREPPALGKEGERRGSQPSLWRTCRHRPIRASYSCRLSPARLNMRRQGIRK